MSFNNLGLPITKLVGCGSTFSSIGASIARPTDFCALIAFSLFAQIGETMQRLIFKVISTLFLISLTTVQAPNLALAESKDHSNAETYYRSIFFLSGTFARASIVCDQDWKEFAKTSVDILAAPEFQALLRAYPEKTNGWIKAGGANFNNGVMQDGVASACETAVGWREQARKQLGSATAASCVKDPAENEPTCNHEARMAVAKRHGFSELSHAEMSERVWSPNADPQIRREADEAAKKCMKQHNFCDD